MRILVTTLAMLAIGFCIPAQAITIDLIPNQSAIITGDAVAIDVQISGLDINDVSLGAYDLSLNFDDSLFAFDSVIWGDSSLGNQLDLSGFGSLQSIDAGISWLNIFEISLDSTFDLNSLQTGEFTLFSIVFNSLTSGTGNFTLSANAIGDAYGNELITDDIHGTSIQVSTVSLPEPHAFWLLLSMLAVIAIRFRRQ